MKKILLTLIALILLPNVLAINLDVNVISEDKVMIHELQDSMNLELQIKNNGLTDNIEFYNLAGFEMTPIGTVAFNAEETKNIELQVKPIGKITQKGLYTLKYYIRSQDDSEIKKDYTFKIVELQDMFEIGASEFNPETESLKIYIKNKEDYNFEEISIQFSSIFFSLNKTTELNSKETKEFTIELNKEDYKKVIAGNYELKAEINYKEVETIITGNLNFIEKEILKSTEENSGLIINTKIITKENQGNTIKTSTTTVEKNILTRALTTLEPEPTSVKRDGFTVYYIWNQEILPGETAQIQVKTNYLIPIFVILFIIVIIAVTKQYTKSDVLLKKRVSFIKSKGGEFALKVSIFVKAKTFVEGISVVDRLPPLVKIHERFMQEQPRKVDEKARRIEWGFDRLEAGEVRVLSYVLYSKVGILGKFILPSAFAIFSKNGKIKEVNSNRAFFVSEVTKNSE